MSNDYILKAKKLLNCSSNKNCRHQMGEHEVWLNEILTAYRNNSKNSSIAAAYQILVKAGIVK